MSRIRIQISFEVDEPEGCLAKWPLDVVSEGISTMIDDGRLPSPVQVWDERVNISIVSAATLARRARKAGCDG